MKGQYSVSVQNNKVKYEFTIKRNITIIQGDSATGKTTLVDLIREYQLDGADSGISLSCKKKCVVLEGADWERNLSLYDDCIVFVDEGNRFIATPEFARAIKTTDNYYVLITREGLETLPYSVNEIYGIHTSGKYADLKQVYHEFYSIYGVDSKNYNEKQDSKGGIEKVLCEDSNSGFDFFSAVFAQKYECESANGKSNIYKKLLASSKKSLVIADGAAFGSQMAKVMKIAEKTDCVLFLPESFEYILLASVFAKDSEVAKVLEHPEDFIESKDFFSWEQLFTALLTKISDGTYLKYSKKKLNPNYLSEKIRNAILNSEIMKGVELFIRG